MNNPKTYFGGKIYIHSDYLTEESRVDLPQRVKDAIENKIVFHKEEIVDVPKKKTSKK